MKQIDIISKYLEALRTGQSHEQAELLAKSWAEALEMHPEAASKQDLRELRTELMSQFTIMKALGGAIFLACCLPYLTKFFGH